VLWSLASFVFEVPSGVWADLVDRRRLLVLSALVYAGGFTCWIVWPSYAGFAVGFVLWGLSGAMMSGTFEALLYDEMVARAVGADYPRLLGWAHSAAMTANFVATVAAAPLFVMGGYELVGWVSVAIAAGQALLAATLPTSGHRRHAAVGEVAHATETVLARYLAMLRSGVREATRAADVRRAALVSAGVVGASAYDEYFPLVAEAHRAPTAVIPALLGLVVVGQVTGTALAGRCSGMSASRFGWAVVVAGCLISTGALLAPWIGFVVIAVGYGLLNNAMIVSEARLQQVITGPARATVTSMAGLGTEVVALVVYIGFAAAGRAAGVPLLVAVLGLPMVLLGLVARRRLPEPSQPREPAQPLRQDGGAR
jgi:MFS family permease